MSGQHELSVDCPCGPTVESYGIPPERKRDISDLFEYHAPTPQQVESMKRVREAAKALALVIDEFCPPSADRTDAMRQLQNCNMTANRSIVLNGKGYR